MIKSNHVLEGPDREALEKGTKRKTRMIEWENVKTHSLAQMTINECVKSPKEAEFMLIIKEKRTENINNKFSSTFNFELRIVATYQNLELNYQSILCYVITYRSSF